MTRPESEDAMIEALFSEARDSAPEPDAALMARVLADAARVRDEPRPAPVAFSVWSQVRDAIGGWPTLGGLAVAGCAGLWIGVAPPALVEDAAASLWGSTATISFAVSDFDAFEGLSDG